MISIWAYLLIIVSFVYIGFRIKKSLHMLQLNSYRNERYMRWINNNKGKVFRKRDLLPILGIVLYALDWQLIGILVMALMYVLLFLTRGKEPEKKKLVVTARVKRLITTNAVLVLVLTGVGVLIGEFLLMIILAVLSFLVFFLVLVANTINLPIEKQINQYYFNDAERIVKQSSNLDVVGITGSYGKTSVKHIVNTVLSSQYNVLMTPESYNTKLGVTVTIRNMLKPIHEIFIAEMGAKQENDIQEICDLVHQKYGILTSVGEQHLETFKTLDNIKKTKFELIESLPSDGIGFLNKDDENIMSYEVKNNCRLVFYGIDAVDLDYRAEDIRFSAKGSHFKVVKKDGSSAEFQTKLLGKHNIYNILAAVALGSELGISLEKLALAVRKVQPVKHRLEIKQRAGNVTVIDDSFNSNPRGSKMALEVLGQMDGKKILVTPGMIELGDKEYELNKAFGGYAADACDYVILVGEKQTKPIQDGLKEKGYPESQIYIAKHLNDGIAHLNTITEAGSIILFENDLPDNFNE
jgi:UDP-N-acetylmuramoyl-tripeptide--D-alanyl-D-alanine ligase